MYLISVPIFAGGEVRCVAHSKVKAQTKRNGCVDDTSRQMRSKKMPKKTTANLQTTTTTTTTTTTKQNKKTQMQKMKI